MFFRQSFESSNRSPHSSRPAITRQSITSVEESSSPSTAAVPQARDQQPSSPASEESLIGFVGVFQTTDEVGHVGAAMVTNDRGYPLEFRISTAVRPSAVQRALYGDSLDPYIEAELVGKVLVAQLKRSPAVLLVNRLGLLETAAKTPVVFLARADAYVRSEATSLRYRRLDRGDDPSRALALVSAGTEAELVVASEVVARAAQRFDPVEAFDRMRTAISVLAESDQRYG